MLDQTTACSPGHPAARTRRQGARAARERVVFYSLHRGVFLWPLILTGFAAGAVVRAHPDAVVAWGWAYAGVLLWTIFAAAFEVAALRALVWGLAFACVWLASAYLEGVRHVAVLSPVFAHLRALRPALDPGFAVLVSWLLLGPWVGAVCHTLLRGRTSFAPNTIEEWFAGEGRELIDRSGLTFRARYADLLESLVGLGCGNLEAVDAAGTVVRRWENLTFLFFRWRRLDRVLHERAALMEGGPAA
jgi:hypothetical protein